MYRNLCSLRIREYSSFVIIDRGLLHCCTRVASVDMLNEIQ